MEVQPTFGGGILDFAELVRGGGGGGPTSGVVIREQDDGNRLEEVVCHHLGLSQTIVGGVLVLLEEEGEK